MELFFRHPEAGEMVGDYRIVRRIGSGGSGTVFQAERAGLFFAVKMLWSGELGVRARRELGILLHLDHPGVARFRACDRWLDPKIGTPYLVTDFVPGLTLQEYAEVKNPSARKSARIILESARTLGDVHLQGVFHRDVKPANIIIQGEEERPILIDFGVGTYAGAPVITPFGLPPGTHEFRAPEAYLFNPADTELARYEFSATDELWALGVTFYWMLTRVLPFGERGDRVGGGLGNRILHQSPLAPHVLNPRVPRALSDICMKMLEKKPEDRYAAVEELCAALEGAMAEAEADASWELPLFEPDATGSGPLEEAPAPPEAPRAIAAPRPPASRHRARPATAAVLTAVLLGLTLVTPSPRSRPESAPLPTSSAGIPTQQAEPGHEVAMCVKPLESVGGALSLLGSSTPAPFAIAMLHKDDTSLKTEETRAPKGQRQGLRALVKKGCVGTACCAALTGCPGAQVRPTPPQPEPCPAGAVETMKQLGIDIGRQLPATFHLTAQGASFITVQEGETTLDLLGDWGKLPQQTLFSGRLIFGDERVYGRLTEARLPGGETFKVCLEIWDEEGGRGVRREPGGGPGSARIFSTVDLTAVRSFK